MSYGAEYGDGDDEDQRDDDDETNEVDRLCREAILRLEIGDFEGAREIANEAVALDEDHPFPLFVLGLVAEQEGDIPTARYLSDQALRAASTNADAIQFRAQLHVREYEFDAAERLLRFCIAHNPYDSSLHESLARVFLARGKHSDALQAAQSSLRIDPSNPGALAVRVAALDDSGDSDQLLAVLRQAVQMHPDDPYSMVELAAVEAEHGNVDRARVLLARAQRIAPNDTEIQDARVTIEGAHDWPLLQPLPRLLRWLHDFPGGLTGFVLAFLVASVPLHQLTAVSPGYALPAWALMGAWATVAFYAWIGPPLLISRLNLGAARVARARATTAGFETDRLVDIVALYFAARRFGEGTRLLGTAAPTLPSPAAEELAAAATRLRRPHERLLQLLASVPADSRLLIALAAALFVAAPVLHGLTDQPIALLRSAGVLVALLSWLPMRVELRALRQLEAALESAHLQQQAAPAGDVGETWPDDPRSDLRDAS